MCEKAFWPTDALVQEDCMQMAIDFDQPMILCDEEGNVFAEMNNGWPSGETNHHITNPVVTSTSDGCDEPEFGHDGFWDKEEEDGPVPEGNPHKNMPRIRMAFNHELGQKTTKAIFKALVDAGNTTAATTIRATIWKKYNALKKVRALEIKERAIVEEKEKLLKIIREPLTVIEPTVQFSSATLPPTTIEQEPAKRKVGRPRKPQDPNKIKRGRGRPKSDKPPKSPKPRGRLANEVPKERDLINQLPSVASGAHDELIILNPVNPAMQRSESGCPFTIELPAINKVDTQSWSKVDAGRMKQTLNIEMETVAEIIQRKPRITVAQVKKTNEKRVQTNEEIEMEIFGGLISETDGE